MNWTAFWLFLHVSGVVIWVGGMSFAHQCLRPVAAQQLHPPQRLPLWVGVFSRFFLPVFKTSKAWSIKIRSIPPPPMVPTHLPCSVTSIFAPSSRGPCPFFSIRVHKTELSPLTKSFGDYGLFRGHSFDEKLNNLINKKF